MAGFSLMLAANVKGCQEFFSSFISNIMLTLNFAVLCQILFWSWLYLLNTCTGLCCIDQLHKCLSKLHLRACDSDLASSNISHSKLVLNHGTQFTLEYYLGRKIIDMWWTFIQCFTCGQKFKCWDSLWSMMGMLS